MPTIPRYSSQETPGVSQARQSIQSSPDAFGAAQGRAMQDVSRGLDVVAARFEEMQAEADETAATEAYVAASDDLRNRMRGENGFLTLQGENAEEGYNALLKDVDDLPNRYASGLSPAAREIFEANWVNRRESAANQGATHVFNQRQARREAAVSAEITDRRNNAIENFADPTAFNGELAAAEGAVRRRGATLGLDPDAINAAVDENRSATILVAVNAALDNGDTASAQRLVETYGGDDGFLIGADRASAEGLIRTATERTRDQATTDELYARFGSDERAAIRFIRANYEGEEEDRLISRYAARAAEDAASSDAVEVALIERAQEVVDAGGSIYDMSAGEYAALPAPAREYFLRRERGEPSRTDYEAFSAYMQLEPQQLRDILPSVIRTHLEDDEYNQVINRRNNTMSESDFTRIQTVNSVVSTVAENNDFNEEKTSQFFRSVQTRIRAEEEVQGRRLTLIETEEIANAYAAEVVFSRPRDGIGRIFGGSRSTTVRPGVLDDDRPVLENVPVRHRQAVVAAFAGVRGGVAEDVAEESYSRALVYLNQQGLPVNSFTIEDRVGFEYLLELNRLEEAVINADSAGQ
jgi:hypothetical protein